MPKNRDKVRGLSERGKRFKEIVPVQSERACALVVTELISDLLERIFVWQFEYTELPKKQREKLLSYDRGMLATFGAKVLALRAFGFIGPRCFAALESLRVIRNHCAHFADDVSLSDKEISNEMRVLKEYADLIAPEVNYDPQKFGHGNTGVWRSFWARRFDASNFTEAHCAFLDSVYALHFAIEHAASNIVGELSKEIMNRMKHEDYMAFLQKMDP